MTDAQDTPLEPDVDVDEVTVVEVDLDDQADAASELDDVLELAELRDGLEAGE